MILTVRQPRLAVLCVGLDPFMLRLVRSCRPDVDVRVADDADLLLQQLSRDPDVIIHMPSGPLDAMLASAEVDQRLVAIVDPSGEVGASGAAQVLMRPVEARRLSLAIDRASGRLGRFSDRIVELEAGVSPRSVFAVARVVGAIAMVVAAGVPWALTGGPETREALVALLLMAHAAWRLRNSRLDLALVIGDVVLVTAVAASFAMYPTPAVLLILLGAAEIGFVDAASRVRSLAAALIGLPTIILCLGLLGQLGGSGPLALMATMVVALIAALLGVQFARITSDEQLRHRRALTDVHTALRDLHRHARTDPDRLHASTLRREILTHVQRQLGADRVALAHGAPDNWDRPIVAGFVPDPRTARANVHHHVIDLRGASAVTERVMTDLVGGGQYVAAAPLRFDGLLLGVLVAAWETKPWVGRRRQILRDLDDAATDAAIAIDSAELFAAVDELSVTGERRRIARDLHDGIVQSFVHVGLELDRLADDLTDIDLGAALEIIRLRHVVNETVEDARSVIGRLGSRHLDAGLRQAIATLLRELRSVNGPELVLEWELLDEPGPELATELFRVVQEALANARTHAGAQRIRICLTRQDDELVLVVEDDGAGIDPDAPTNGLRGHGLPAMRDRLELLGGALHVGLNAHGGTTVRASVAHGSRSPIPPLPVGDMGAVPSAPSGRRR